MTNHWAFEVFDICLVRPEGVGLCFWVSLYHGAPLGLANIGENSLELIGCGRFICDFQFERSPISSTSFRGAGRGLLQRLGNIFRGGLQFRLEESDHVKSLALYSTLLVISEEEGYEVTEIRNERDKEMAMINLWVFLFVSTLTRNMMAFSV